MTTQSALSETPLASIAEAQRRIRTLREAEDYEPQAIRVHIAGGRYTLTEPIRFNDLDSGTEEHPVSYVGSTGEPTVLCGGVNLDLSQLSNARDDARLQALPEEVRQNIWSLDLRQQGIDSITPVQRRIRNASLLPTGAELFVDGQRQQLAGWPNEGWSKLASVDSARGSWTVTGLKPTVGFEQAWVHGFFTNDWQDHFQRVSVRALEHGAVNLALEDSLAPSLRSGARFRIENLLSELDSVAEYYLDRENLLLYIYSTERPTADTAYLSNLETPVSLYDVEYLSLTNLTIEGSRVCGVEIAGGRNVALENCTLKNIGNIGVNVFHGYQHAIRGCEVYNTGAGAIRVDGGDRQQLFSGEFLIENCWLHNFAQLQLAYRPAINVYGVGTTIARNRINEGPHAAIILHGNEHVVDSNEIHHVCTATDDVGAIYLAHDPTYRGNQIRNNYIHDLGGFSQTGVIGVYLDDFASGTTVEGNILERAGRGVAIGGGRDNRIENNLFFECLAAIQIDCRGTTWASSFFAGKDSPYSQLLNSVSADSGIYAERYPELATTYQDEPQIAKGNRIMRNLYDGSIGVDLHDQLDGRIVQVGENFGQARELLTFAESGEFTLKEGTIGASSGFRTVKLPELGWRASGERLVSEELPSRVVD
jgi:parallel beta-helix repeat protein